MYNRLLLAIICLFYMQDILAQESEIIINDSYSLWYNRSNFVLKDDSLNVGALSSGGDVKLLYISRGLSLEKVDVLFKFNSPSDHGSPALVREGKGLVACFSNHSSELYCAYNTNENGLYKTKIVDSGRNTYQSLVTSGNAIILMSTFQITGINNSEKRVNKVRISVDGGQNWSVPKTIYDGGDWMFPYTTPLDVSRNGEILAAYSVYDANKKRCYGLNLQITNDIFETWTTIPIDIDYLGLDDLMPYEAKWLDSGLLFITFSGKIGSEDGFYGYYALVDPSTLKYSVVQVGKIAFHHYPSGLSVSRDGKWIALSEIEDEEWLTIKNTELNISKRIKKGTFSSPFIIDSSNDFVRLGVLNNPKVNTTREFSADMLIIDANVRDHY